MVNNAAIVRFWEKYGMAMLMLCVTLAMVLLPDLAHASDTSTGDKLPFVTPLDNLASQLKGPVAFSISLVGIVAAGAILIFGGELSGFMRSMVFLVLVIAVLVNAQNILDFIKTDAATIAMRRATVNVVAMIQGSQSVVG